MIGGYQIIDLNQCTLDSGYYYWITKIAPDLRKPLRLQGIKGKSTNNPTLDVVNDWTTTETTVNGDGATIITYTYIDSTAQVEVGLSIFEHDMVPGMGVYGIATITDNT